MTETSVPADDEQQQQQSEGGGDAMGVVVDMTSAADAVVAVTAAVSQQSLDTSDEPRAISSSDTTNSLSRSETYSVGDMTLDGQVCGWLTMRGRISKKWKRRWFLLEKSYLRYGNCEKKLSGKIMLDGAKIRETVKDQKQFAFSIEGKSGHRIYYLHADNETIRNKWMQAMCFAKFSHSSDENLSLCTTS